MQVESEYNHVSFEKQAACHCTDCMQVESEYDHVSFQEQAAFHCTDCMQVESEYDHVSFEEQADAMGSLIREGKVRHWGLSNESSYGVMMHCFAADKLNVPRPISVQNSFSLLHRYGICYYCYVEQDR